MAGTLAGSGIQNQGSIYAATLTHVGAKSLLPILSFSSYLLLQYKTDTPPVTSNPELKWPSTTLLGFGFCYQM